MRAYSFADHDRPLGNGVVASILPIFFNDAINFRFCVVACFPCPRYFALADWAIGVRASQELDTRGCVSLDAPQVFSLPTNDKTNKIRLYGDRLGIVVISSAWR